jgi:hypothetical protein
MSEALEKVVLALADAVLKLNEKIDTLGSTAKTAAKSVEEVGEVLPKPKRGRPKGSTNKKAKAQKASSQKPAQNQEELLIEDDDDLEDDDDGLAPGERDVYQGNDKRLAISSGLRTGKRKNIFDDGDIPIPADITQSDKRIKQAILDGKVRVSKGRAPAKQVITRCTGCQRKFKVFKASIIREENWKCNGCSQGGA